MKRRAFIRSLGGAVAAAMVPFARPIEVVFERPAAGLYRAYWTSPEYLKSLKSSDFDAGGFWGEGILCQEVESDLRKDVMKAYHEI